MSCMCLHPIHMLCGNECPAYEVGACLQEPRQVPSIMFGYDTRFCVALAARQSVII